MRYETYAKHTFECKYTGSQNFTQFCIHKLLLVAVEPTSQPANQPSNQPTNRQKPTTSMCTLYTLHRYFIIVIVWLKAVTQIQTTIKPIQTIASKHIKQMNVNGEDFLCAFPKYFFLHHHHHRSPFFSALANSEQKKNIGLYLLLYLAS